MLIALAWRNLWRRPQRTLLTLASIAVVTALLVFVLSFQQGAYGAMKEISLRVFDGYAQLQPPGWADDPTLDRAIDRPAVLLREAEAVPGVGVATERVNTFGVLAHGPRSYGAAVVGVDPGREARVSSLPSLIRAGRFLRPSDDNAAILGDVLARNLDLSVGEDVTVLGEGRDGSVAADVLHVVGLYHSGVADLDRSILEMPLARAQQTFGMEGAVTTIALSGSSLEAVNGAVPALRVLGRRAGVAVRDWAALEPAIHQTIDLKYTVAMLFYATLVVVTAFILLNTLLMSVLERTREFAVLLALGMRPGGIGAMVWLELLGLALLGCLIGLVVGGALTLWLQAQGVALPVDPKLLSQYGVPSRLYPTLTFTSALFGPVALIAAVSVGGIAPYLRVMGLAPAMATRGP
jgi:ABC-type lipoprotein release transport system permease subunit